jgi:hypothetical protein
MMGEQRDNQQRLFYSFNLDEHVPADHLLRGILVLQGGNVRGAMLNQAHALTGQIAQPSLALRVDIPGRQDPESHQVRKPEGVMLVVRVLESVILNNRPRVHQAHLVSRIHSTHRPTSTN